MTYKEIINRFREVVEDHWMIQDFGYGELSDIKTQSQLGPEEQGTDYPYMFLNPTSHTRTGPVMNYSFNMIMMDMARGEEGDVYDNYITIQSQCQQYIDDVLSQLYYGYSDKPEIQLTGITYTPFKEKYQDTLAGMTATITIQVPTPIDNCTAPFIAKELKSWYTESTPYTYGEDSGEDRNLFMNEVVISGAGYPWRWNVNRIQPQGSDFNGRLELTMEVQPLSATGSVVPNPFEIIVGGVAYTYPGTVLGWPTVVDDQVHEVTITWESITLPVDVDSYIRLLDQPETTANITVTNPNLKFYA